MTHVACFVAAALYSAYSMGAAPGNNGHSEGGGNCTGANHTSTTANGAAAEYASANSSKIDDYTLFATIGTLSAAWAIAFIGLLLTMKRKYPGTFVPLQTGCAYSRSHFLDHPGDDARRILIFSTNQWHWRSIRDLVLQWVLGAYTAWRMLSPAWRGSKQPSASRDAMLPTPVV